MFKLLIELEGCKVLRAVIQIGMIKFISILSATYLVTFCGNIIRACPVQCDLLSLRHEEIWA